jgi:hypothetical protein
LKREVLLEVAPAIQRNYHSLWAILDLNIPFLDMTERLRKALTESSGSISKLQVVASTETLEAARQVQTFLGRTYVRMLSARIKIGDRRGPDASMEIMDIWRKEIESFPLLLATLVAQIRQELHLSFDKQQFLSGIIDSNTQLLAEFDKMVETFH